MAVRFFFALRLQRDGAVLRYAASLSKAIMAFFVRDWGDGGRGCGTVAEVIGKNGGRLTERMTGERGYWSGRLLRHGVWR
ncbi:MAG TPA: hypothetical protein H9863_02555 [Candidatus Odoribacter faecigallinarum]|uniref:Uncharacterized protein n=1 Tax=Candidatus Odoribacter faecigallinarum TaxID=2838706 RepID=A0A9D1UZJ3_9BACT|nr:hypothetical protein [Candidatus Odoribacter faecigallinarum]